MPTIVIGGFAASSDADAAIRTLEEEGYSLSDISVISRAGDRSQVNAAGTGGASESSAVQDTIRDTASGAVAGGAVGGIAGLLAGAGVLPALGGLLIGGPIAALLGATGVAAAAISGAATGAMAGGLIGALTNLGVPEEVARRYDRTISEGGIVLTVPVEGDEETEVAGIFRNHRAIEVRSVTIQA